jgi:hypothetical protein
MKFPAKTLWRLVTDVNDAHLCIYTTCIIVCALFRNIKHENSQVWIHDLFSTDVKINVNIQKYFVIILAALFS